MQDQFKETLEKILEKLDTLEMMINRVQPIQPIYPSTPRPPSLTPTTCSKCGMVWQGVMGYVCSQSDCPVQFKVTSQISTPTGGFNIESLDPGQRSWYYDGDGNKRHKDE